MNSLYAAIQGGAGAVYLGGTLFGARAFAGNFNNDELKECALRAINNAGYSAEDIVWDVFFSRISEEKTTPLG